MPYSNRKSIFFEEDTFMDLTFKGYIIIYNINEVENQIEVFEFVKYTEKP